MTPLEYLRRSRRDLYARDPELVSEVVRELVRTGLFRPSMPGHMPVVAELLRSAEIEMRSADVCVHPPDARSHIREALRKLSAAEVVAKANNDETATPFVVVCYDTALYVYAQLAPELLAMRDELLETARLQPGQRGV